MAYEAINHANLYYSLRGYQKIHAPWIVEQKFSNITKPENKRNFTIPKQAHSVTDIQKVLVGSGEQSFLELISQKKINPGVFYQTTTPCFRDELEDDLHHKYFLKTELIYFEYLDKDLGTSTPKFSQQINRMEDKADQMIKDCVGFFNQYLFAQLIPINDPEAQKDQEDHFYLFNIIATKSTLSSLSQPIKLGSYGIRQHENVIWVYGTGCAEPRLSYAVGHENRPSYHLDLIPKTHRIGSVEKIIEEYNEFIDAVKQGTSVMELVELSDLIGAIDCYLKQNHNKSLQDLILFSQITQRAVINGRS